MPSYEFHGQLSYRLTDADAGDPLPIEDQADVTVIVYGYPGKLVTGVPYAEGTVVMSVLQDGVLFSLEPDGDGVLHWVEEVA